MAEFDVAGNGAGGAAVSTSGLMDTKGPGKFREVLKNISTEVKAIGEAFAQLGTKADTNLAKIEKRLTSILALSKQVNTALAGTGMSGASGGKSAPSTPSGSGAPMANFGSSGGGNQSPVGSGNLVNTFNAPNGGQGATTPIPMPTFQSDEQTEDSGGFNSSTFGGTNGGVGNGASSSSSPQAGMLGSASLLSGGGSSSSSGSGGSGGSGVTPGVAAAGFAVATAGAVGRFASAKVQEGFNAYSFGKNISNQTNMDTAQAIKYGTGFVGAVDQGGDKGFADRAEAFQALQGSAGVGINSSTFNSWMKTAGSASVLGQSIGASGASLTQNANYQSWLVGAGGLATRNSLAKEGVKGIGGKPTAALNQFSLTEAAYKFSEHGKQLTAAQIAAQGKGTGLYKTLLTAAGGDTSIEQEDQSYLEMQAKARQATGKTFHFGAAGETAAQTQAATKAFGLNTGMKGDPYANLAESTQKGAQATANFAVGVAQATSDITRIMKDWQDKMAQMLSPDKQQAAGRAAGVAGTVTHGLVKTAEAAFGIHEAKKAYHIGKDAYKIGKKVRQIRKLRRAGNAAEDVGKAAEDIAPEAEEAAGAAEVVGDVGALATVGAVAAPVAIGAAAAIGGYELVKHRRGIEHFRFGFGHHHDTPAQALEKAEKKAWAKASPGAKANPHWMQEFEQNYYQHQQKAGNAGKQQAASSGGGAATPAKPAAAVSVAASGAGIVSAAAKEEGLPYVWGGGSATGPTTGIAGDPGGNPVIPGLKGFDCSGLTMYALHQNGVSVPHLAAAQQVSPAGAPVKSLAEAVPGDLIFYGNPADHVTIYAGNGQMIAAPHTGENVQKQAVYGSPSSFRRFKGNGSPSSSSQTGTGANRLTNVGAGGSNNMTAGGSSAPLGEGVTISESSALAAVGSPAFSIGSGAGGSTAPGGLQAAASTTASTNGTSGGNYSGGSGGNAALAAIQGVTKNLRVTAAMMLGSFLESGFNPKAAGPGSYGLWQLQLSAHPGVTVANAEDPSYAAKFMIGGYTAGAAAQGDLWKTDPEKAAEQAAYAAERPSVNYYQGQGVAKVDAGWAAVTKALGTSSFEGGSMYIEENQMAQLHRGEMVIRAGAAGAMRMNQLSGGNSFGNGGGVTVVFEKGALEITWNGSSAKGSPNSPDLEDMADQLGKAIERKFAMRKMATS